MTDDAPPPEDLDALVARVDPDRWLSSRLIADPEARADAIAIYAYDHELARAPRVASNPLLGEIRLTWWREVLDETFEGRAVRRHPTAQALAAAVRRHDLPRTSLEAMIDARYRELDPAPMAPEEALAWARGTAGEASRLVARRLAGAADGDKAEAAGAAWALARRPEADRAQIEALLAQAKGVGVAAFPAAAHASLAQSYLRGRPGSDLRKRARITWAALTGRL
ncbi:MAG: squalene/phytoene synthase family protein [Pseudomonadota bacterium]|jgi:phytoene synthase